MAWTSNGVSTRYKDSQFTVDRLLASSDTCGTVGASTVKAIEYGHGADHLTVLTLTNFAVGTSGDNASLGFGALLYTFPAGIILVERSGLIACGVTAAISVTTDTPEIGLGTVVATGAIATLGAGSATMEDISEGGDTTNIAPDVNGTATINSTKIPTNATGDDGPKIIAAASAHTVYLNIADGWADVTAAGAVTVSGTIFLKWQKLT